MLCMRFIFCIFVALNKETNGYRAETPFVTACYVGKISFVKNEVGTITQ